MPGLAGFISSSRRPQREFVLDAMIQSMRHESFYTSGTLVQEDLGLWLGWVSHAGSFADCLPAWNETRDICVILSGEVFCAEELEELKRRGHDIPEKDARGLVHWYEEKGSDFLVELNGSFSGVIIDLREKKIVLFNDRYGLNRIYYHESNEGLYFASEAKALLKVLPKLRELDPAGLGEFLSCGCALEDRTLFRGVRLLPGASKWTFRLETATRKERYFSLSEWEHLPAQKPDEYCANLVSTFSQILPRYLNGKQPVALSLTGGLDSRMVLAWSRRAPGSLPSYTIAGPYRECADVRIARQIAKLCEQPHTTLRIGGDFFQTFPALAEKTIQVSDGAMDVSGAVELYVNRLAREVAPVRLTGNYGSEILRSNVAFRPGRSDTAFYSAELARLTQTASETYRAEAGGRRLSFIAFKQVPWHHYARLAVEKSQLTPRSPFLDNDLVALAYQAPEELACSPEPLLNLIAEGNQALTSLGTDRALGGNSHSVFAAVARRWQDFTAKAEYAYDYGMPDWLATIDRQLAPLRPERLFLGRHKFYHFRVWYRGPLSAYVKSVLLDSKALARPYLDARRVEKIVDDHVTGRRNHTLQIHKLLSMELIQRHLIEQN